MSEDTNSAFDPTSVFDVRPAAQPGAHAPAGFLSPEYDEEIVSNQLFYLESGEMMSVAEMENHQVERLRELLTYAGKYVPYWRSLFRSLNFEPREVVSIADLARLPLLTKEMIKENYREFISERITPETLTYMTSGGSTGAPLKILMDREYRSRNHTATRYYLAKAGIFPGKQRSVRLHGNSMPSEVLARGEYWVYEGTRLTMSVYHITPETCHAYMEAIRRFEPVYIHAYASALALLAGYAERANEPFPDSISSVFCDSETTYSWQRELIERVTGARFFNTYGHTEGAGMAITFPDSACLEALPQVGVMEILDPAGQVLGRPGDRGEIVVTGFNNKVMPFIRYRTFDIAVLGNVEPGHLRPYRPILANIEGRLQDYLVAIDGGLVPAAPLLFDYNFDWSGIDTFQVAQKQPGQLQFKIVPDMSQLTDVEVLCKRVIDGFSRLLGPGFKISVSIHSSLPCTGRGKFRYVDQALKIDA
jgi:phenylacetate-CoA ligase